MSKFYLYPCPLHSYCFCISDLGPFSTRDPRFPLPGNMNIDVNMHCETLQMPENQQSLASAFLDIETTEMKKHQVLAQFMHNTRVDDNKKAKLTNQNNSKEIFESAKVHVLYTYMILRVLQLQ